MTCLDSGLSSGLTATISTCPSLWTELAVLIGLSRGELDERLL